MSLEIMSLQLNQNIKQASKNLVSLLAPFDSLLLFFGAAFPYSRPCFTSPLVLLFEYLRCSKRTLLLLPVLPSFPFVLTFHKGKVRRTLVLSFSLFIYEKLEESQGDQRNRRGLDKQPLLGFFISFFPFFSSSFLRTGTPSGSPKKKYFFEGGKDLEPKVVTTSSKKLRKTRFSNKNFEKISYEEIGLFPRSFSRVFDRFVKQLFYDVENLVVQEYRFYRYLFLTTVKCVFLFLFFPLFVNFLAKNYLVRPLTEYLWNTKQSQIFLNAYQQKHAFAELKYFEEKLYFESLVLPNPKTEKQSESLPLNQKEDNQIPFSLSSNPQGVFFPFEHPPSYTRVLRKGVQKEERDGVQKEEPKGMEAGVKESENSNSQIKETFSSSNEELGKKNRIAALQFKTVQLAMTYNSQSIEAITNFFADLISVISFFYLLVAMEIPINISKSFLLEVFFGLDDSKKSLLILLVTDLLVGYHSDGPWAIFFESLFNHYGLPESQTGIFLLVATLPVLLDVLFKYLIFRHLNRASPATVATYHAMIE